MCPLGFVTAQDTLFVNGESLNEIVTYKASEKIVHDVKNRRIYLYGAAEIQTEGYAIKSGYILIDLDSSQIEAKYRLDSIGKPQEFPELTEGSQTITCESLKFNYRTEKAYIKALAMKQDEFYFQMGTAKRQANDELHLKQGILTTCDLAEPHYHFQLSKGVLVPNERIVTGPMNLYVSGIPTPLGLPFAFIPTNQKERTSGLLFPEFVPLSAYGFGFQNLGWYFPINERFQTSVYANLYSRGSWGLRNDLDYAKRYGYNGRLSLGFQQFNSGFPTNTKQNKVTIVWSHRKAPKSNPFWDFSSNVNFISDNNSKNSLDPINPEYFNNSFNSDINLARNFPGKPINTGLKMSLRQNSKSKTVSLLSPVMNVNVTRIFPFKNTFETADKNWKKTIQRIGLTYNFEGQNRAQFADSLMSTANFAAINQTMMNGLSQSLTIQTSTGLFKNALKINPNLSYGNKINFQQIEKSYNPLTNNTKIDTIQKPSMSHELNFNLSATTVLYAYYKFAGKKQTRLRHLMTPNIGYRYTPGWNPLLTVNAGPNQSLITYSPFERSIYGVGSTREASLLTFGINNTAEIKFKSAQDTVTGFKKIRLIDQFSVTGNYDFTKDTMKLSNLSLNLRISPANWINFVSNANWSPYGWNANGQTIKDYAWQTGQQLGRLTTTNLTTTMVIAPRKDRKKLQDHTTLFNEQDWNADFNFYALHPERAIFYDIPWKVNLSHVYGIQANQDISLENPDPWSFVQTLVFSGDISFTKRWNLSGNLNFNLQDQRLTNAYFSLNRNMHCWALSFYYVPVGGNKSFLLTIRNTSSIFRDAKLEFRKPPSFL
ncbi:MAG: putative LPS assembly protein LptD [Flavobacteriales bacterium]